MCFVVLEFSKGMILPKKDIDNSPKPTNVCSKDSLKNVHNSENVSLKTFINKQYKKFFFPC